jgi:3-oxoacyl-[acyl-carrier-protein] synthase II
MVAAAASGHRLFDAIEARALARAVGPRVPITAPKSIFGETNGSAGALNIVAGLLMLRGGFIPPIEGLIEPLQEAQLDWVRGSTRSTVARDFLVSAFSPGGAYYAVALRMPHS